MPDFTTHYLFGEQVLELLPEEMQSLIDQNRAVFNYATEGPDFLFFRKVLTGVFTGFSNLPEAGSLMHSKHITQTMDFMKSYISSKQTTGKEYDVLRVYFMGFICHYYLDKTVHPYVYYLENQICSHHPERTPRSMHARIESELDTILYEFFKHRPVTSFPVRACFTMDSFSKNVIARMFTELLESVFGIETQVGEVMKSFDDMRNATIMLFDNSGVLPAVRNIVGEVFPKTLDLTYMIKAKRVKTDTANFRENQWHHPLHPERKSRRSVLGLFNEAKDQVVEALTTTFQAMDNSDPVLFDTSLDFSGNEI